VQLVSAVSERVLDTNDGVRAAACKAICTLYPLAMPASAAAAADPDLRKDAQVAAEGLEAVGRRLRDKKSGVRAAAAEGLVGVFRAWCSELYSEQKGMRDIFEMGSAKTCVGYVTLRPCGLVGLNSAVLPFPHSRHILPSPSFTCLGPAASRSASPVGAPPASAVALIPARLAYAAKTLPELTHTVSGLMAQQPGGLLPSGLKAGAYACVWVRTAGMHA
jgi:hypothetical protein